MWDYRRRRSNGGCQVTRKDNTIYSDERHRSIAFCAPRAKVSISQTVQNSLSEQRIKDADRRGETNIGSDLRPSSDIIINPAYGATQAVKNLIQSIPKYHTLLVGVPCNTFHAPEIWNVFEAGIQTCVRAETKTDFACNIKIQTLHMVDETIRYIQNVLRHCEKHNKSKSARIGLLSTEGTRTHELS